MKNTLISSITPRSLRDKKHIDIFPEFYELEKITENNLWHNNQNVFDHAVRVFEELTTILKFNNLGKIQFKIINSYLSEKIDNLTRKDLLKVATILHDIAKPDTIVKKPDGTVQCPGHELIASRRVKRFSDRFGLGKNDEIYVKRIVRYHGFISEILNLIIKNGKRERYLEMFKNKVGDIDIELILFMHADLSGSDLKKNDKKAFGDRLSLLSWMLNSSIKT